MVEHKFSTEDLINAIVENVLMKNSTDPSTVLGKKVEQDPTYGPALKEYRAAAQKNNDYSVVFTLALQGKVSIPGAVSLMVEVENEGRREYFQGSLEEISTLADEIEELDKKTQEFNGAITKLRPLYIRAMTARSLGR